MPLDDAPTHTVALTPKQRSVVISALRDRRAFLVSFVDNFREEITLIDQTLKKLATE